MPNTNTKEWLDALIDGLEGKITAPGEYSPEWISGFRIGEQAFEIVAEALAHNPKRYGEVHFPQVLDPYEMTATLDISGVTVSAAHGHQFGKSSGGGSAVTKIENWLRGQALGRQPVADAQILVCGHLHHFLASEGTSRTIFQAPASDTGSAWFTQQTGKWSPPGVLTMNIGESCGPRGWNDLGIL